MDNLDGYREEEVGSRMGGSVTLGVAHMDTILRPIRNYALPSSTTPLVIKETGYTSQQF